MQEMQETCIWSLGREDPWRRAWQPTPVFLPGASCGQRSLVTWSRSWTRLKWFSTHVTYEGVQFSSVTQSHHLHSWCCSSGILKARAGLRVGWVIQRRSEGTHGERVGTTSGLRGRSGDWQAWWLVRWSRSPGGCLEAKLTGSWVCCQEWRRTEGQGVVSSGLYPGAPLHPPVDPKLWTGLN